MVTFTSACFLGWILFVVFILRWFHLASEAEGPIDRSRQEGRQRDRNHVAASANQTAAQAS